MSASLEEPHFLWPQRAHHEVCRQSSKRVGGGRRNEADLLTFHNPLVAWILTRTSDFQYAVLWPLGCLLSSQDVITQYRKLDLEQMDSALRLTKCCVEAGHMEPYYSEGIQIWPRLLSRQPDSH